MRATPGQHHGLTFLPHLFDARTESGTRHAALLARHYVILAAILIPPVALPLFLSRSVLTSQTWHEHLAHSLLEGFCALMSFVVFYVLHQEYILAGARRLRVMAYGFLAMGTVDLLHAISSPGSNLFVWFRCMASFAGASFLALSLLSSFAGRESSAVDARRAWIRAALVEGGTLLFGAASYSMQEFLPSMGGGDSFSWFALLLNGTAGALFLLVGIWFLRQFRQDREIILFVFALAMLLFTESQVLFFFSSLWHFTWWEWHWIRTAIFIGILCGLGYELSASVRDLESSQMRLVESAKLASLGEMAAAVAHEIRNPLGTITSSMGLLQDAQVSENERREVLQILQQEVNRLNHIVSDTLSFARPRPARHRPVDLEHLTRSLLRSLPAQYKGIEVSCVFDPDLPPIIGDSGQLQQVVWNLVDNAAAAIGYRGEIRIHGSQINNAVVLSVADNGPGIPDELQSKVFQPFFSTKPNGTGLGLSIVQRIVTEHGGEIHLKSGTNDGTHVDIEFPVFKDSDEKSLSTTVHAP